MRELTKRERRLLGFSKFIAICLLTSLGAHVAGANLDRGIPKRPTQSAAFTTDDLHAIGRGEIIVKLVPVKDKREVAVCGLVRTQAPLK